MRLMKFTALQLLSLALLTFSFSAGLAAEEYGKGIKNNNEVSNFSSADVEPDVLDENLQPEINVQQFDNREIQEYSINDRVYMIKVTPKHGFPYYLVDPDGTGEMEYKRDTVGLEVNPPQWTLFRW